MRVPMFLAAAAAVLAFSPVNAVTIIGATSIKITNTSDYLQVAEVVALNYVGVDVSSAAKGATASANDQYATFSGADKAIDGITGGDYYNNTIYHGLNPGSSTLTIDFANPTRLASLTIYGRTDCCQQRDVYNVTIYGAGNSVLYSGAFNSAYAPHTLNFDIAAVPEPATWSLLIAGFGMTGFAMRRRKVALTA